MYVNFVHIQESTAQWIPECELMMEWKKKDDMPVRLQYKVKLNGARASKNYFQLVLDPTEGRHKFCNYHNY